MNKHGKNEFIILSCNNHRCIKAKKTCDFVDDCGDYSDEDPNGVCAGYSGCNFDDNQCPFEMDASNDFDWQTNFGETPSSNTGPMHDHTYFNADGW